MNNVGILEMKNGSPLKALALLREALRLRTKVLGPGHGDTLTTKVNVGHAVEASGNMEDALKIFEESLIGLREILAADHPRIQTVLSTIERIKKMR